MTSFHITVQDQQVTAALARLQARLDNAQPVMASIGEHAVERIKRRFETSSAPDGSPWKPNSAATLAAFAESFTKSYRTKAGGLNAKGRHKLANKKPLIGESNKLMDQFERGTGLRPEIERLSASLVSVTLGSTMGYSAIQHLGGQAGRGHRVTIPARPFMPVQANGELYPQEAELILADLNLYLSEGL